MNFKIPAGIIEKFIYTHFSDVRISSTNEIHFNSPFHNDTKKRLYVEPNSGKWFDQKLQKGGDFSSFVAAYLDISSREAATILIKDYSSKEDNEKINFKETIQVKKEIELPEGLTFFIEKNNGIIYNRAKSYLKKRKINPTNLGYIYKPDSFYHNRIFIPFYENGRIIYFQARTFVDSKLRYKNPPGISTKDVVFNIDEIEDEVFIFEGVFDALSLNKQIGTCTLSSSMNKEQAIKILNKGVKEIIFVPDNDLNPKTRRTILSNLNRNVKLIRRYAPPSLNVIIKVWWLPKGIKDFNQYVIETGRDYIDKSECELYDKKNIGFEKLKGMFNGRNTIDEIL